MKITVSTSGEIALPAELRQRDGIRPEQEFEIERLGAGEYLLTRLSPADEGLVDWLLACPQKDYFVRIEPGSTGAIEPWSGRAGPGAGRSGCA